jgi:Holliday junction resolvase RusA-like endonuclease
MSGYTEEWLANRLAKQGAVSRTAVVRDERIEAGREYRLTVYGEPQPAGSKQAFPLLDKKRICRCGPIHGLLPHRRPNGSIIVNVTDDNRDTKTWRNLVSKTAREEYSGPLLTGFVSLECIFYLPRPKGHYGTGANEHRLKPSAPAFPGVKPDHDKLLRAVSDGLTQAGNVYKDDALVVDGIARKRYGSPPRVEITIAEVIVPEPYEQPELFEAPAPWETK